MFNNLIASIEADINKVAAEQQQYPHDLNVAKKKEKLKELAMDYVKLENRYREVAGLNSVY